MLIFYLVYINQNFAKCFLTYKVNIGNVNRLETYKVYTKYIYTIFRVYIVTKLYNLYYSRLVFRLGI